MMTEMPPSPFVQRCLASFESPTNVFFVVDLNLGGDLFSHFGSRVTEGGISKFPESEGRVILAELALAIVHVHAHGYLHKDIKIENVMLDHRGHVKLVDFGYGEFLNADVETVEFVGTVTYMAPELIRYHTGGRHTDWWAYGVVAYELLTGFFPWSSYDDDRAIMREICSQEEIIYPDDLPSCTLTFLRGLLERNYKIRTGTVSDREIQSDHFFENADWERLALLECAPAFIPNESPVAGAAIDQVLVSYSSRSELPESGDLVWYVGFEVVSKHPPYCCQANDKAGALPRLVVTAEEEVHDRNADIRRRANPIWGN